MVLACLDQILVSLQKVMSGCFFSEADSGKSAMIMALWCKNDNHYGLHLVQNSCSWINLYFAQDVLSLGYDFIISQLLRYLLIPSCFL